MPGVGFELTIPASERVRPVHASDGAATVMGWFAYIHMKFILRRAVPQREDNEHKYSLHYMTGQAHIHQLSND
jgi:hypothetical protein